MSRPITPPSTAPTSPVARPVRWMLILTVALSACGGEGDAPPPGGPAEEPDPTASAAPPGSDVWLGLVSSVGDSVVISDLRNVTRRPGYDNQPAFHPERNAFVYTVADSAGETDIHLYDMTEGRSEPLTSTSPESEYSATPIPGMVGFSTVVVEADSAQRLWRYAWTGEPVGVLFADVEPVGYHAWAGEEWVAMFVLGEPPTLRVAGGETAEVRVVARDVGRSIRSIPGEAAVSFVQNLDVVDRADGSEEVSAADEVSGAATASPGPSTRIMRWSHAGGVEPITDGLDGGEFHAWTPDGLLLMGSGPEIRAWREGWERWRTVGRVSVEGTVTRLAVSRDGGRIAVVVEIDDEEAGG